MFMEGSMDDAANMSAINTYITSQPLNTKAARAIHDEWLRWYSGLGWYDLNFPSQAIYDLARNIRNRFNTANAVTPAEKAAVIAVQSSGLSSEEVRGEADRRTSSSQYLGPTEAPEPEEESEPWIPAKTKGVLFLGGLVYVALKLFKAGYIDRFIPPKR